MLQTLPLVGEKCLKMKNYFLMCDVDENWVIEGSYEHIRKVLFFFIKFVYHERQEGKRTLCNVILECDEAQQKYTDSCMCGNDMLMCHWIRFRFEI